MNRTGAGCRTMTQETRPPSRPLPAGTLGLLALAALFAAALGLMPSPLHAAPSLTELVQEILKAKASEVEERKEFLCRREVLCGSKVLCSFYKSRDCRPAWLDDRGPLPQAGDLVRAIRKAEFEGLLPDAYHLEAIESLLAGWKEGNREGRETDAARMAELDILLSDAFLIYGSHLLTGRVNPETIHAEWTIRSREQDLTATLRSALEEKGIEQALGTLPPASPGYRRLQEALVRYRGLERAGGWPEIAAGPTLRPGDRDERVGALRGRLAVTGDLEGVAGNPVPRVSPMSWERQSGVDPAAPSDRSPDPLLFDSGLEQALVRFQLRHGLEPDGVVGSSTLSALNVPAEERVRQLELNLERWRWLPEQLGERYVLVNIADYRLAVVEGGSEVLSMRVVTGKQARHTPVLSGEIRYLVFNPYWTVPHKIAVEDLLPKFRKKPEMVRRDGFRLLRGWGADAPEVSPESVDWARVARTSFPFRLRQDPGPRNALGRVKFIFPNKFSVYLHDSPARDLFRPAKRDFSSGCIRIEKPMELAELLLRGSPSWTPEAIGALVESGETREVSLPRSMPLYLLYWTAWVGPDGAVHFREDIYDRDPVLDKALREGPPRAEARPAA